MAENNVLNFTRQFFARLGIDASVGQDRDGIYVHIPTPDYDSRRMTIDSWFTLVHQTEETSILRERVRGTGQTR